MGEGKLLVDINQLVLDTTFGETGFAFTLNNKTGQVIFSPKTEGAFAIDYDNNLDNDPSLFAYEETSLAEVAKKTGMTKKDTDIAVAAVVDVIKELLAKEDKLQLPSFGTFFINERAAREGRNPQSGEVIHIAASKVPAFRSSKVLKDAIKKAVAEKA